MNHYFETLYLSAKPSFTEGMARVLDLAGSLERYNDSATAELADTTALQRDWQAVGADLRTAIKEYDAR